MEFDLFEELNALPEKYPGPKGVSNNIQYLMGCRSFAQFCSTLRTIARPEEFCVFCNPHLVKNQPLHSTTFWYLKESDFPVKGTSKSLLIIPRRHLVTTEERLRREDGAAMIELLNWAIDHFNIPGGGLVLRFGGVNWHVGTVPHAHFNVLVPTGVDDCVATLGKPRGDRVENYKRLLTFRQELNERGGITWIFSPEGIEFTKQ